MMDEHTSSRSPVGYDDYLYLPFHRLSSMAGRAPILAETPVRCLAAM